MMTIDELEAKGTLRCKHDLPQLQCAVCMARCVLALKEEVDQLGKVNKAMREALKGYVNSPMFQGISDEDVMLERALAAAENVEATE